ASSWPSTRSRSVAAASPSPSRTDSSSRRRPPTAPTTRCAARRNCARPPTPGMARSSGRRRASWCRTRMRAAPSSRRPPASSVSTPIGHTLLGVALARRLGVRSPLGLAAATVASSLPDADVIAGAVLHRDPWRLHRQGTHTLEFALTAGALAGFGGLISAGNADGHRDLVRDALLGALLVAS